MEEERGVVKHILVVKFKEEITDVKIEELVKAFAKLIDIIEPLKGLNWGKDESTENMQLGFTHVFECIFESLEGVAEYLVHPEHVAFGKVFLPCLEKFVMIDYKPIVALA